MIKNGEWNQKFKESKKFLLDVEKSQFFYNELDKLDTYNNKFNTFVLPFDNTTFAFEKPLVIKWVDKESEGTYMDTKLLALTAYKTLEQKEDSGLCMSGFRAYVSFEENMENYNIS